MQSELSRHAEALLGWIKDGPPGAILLAGGGHLQGATWEDAGDARLLARLAAWHDLPTAAARRWLADGWLAPPRRALFWVRAGGEAVGHLGLRDFDFARGAVLMGEGRGEAGWLPAASAGLARWAREAFGLEVLDEIATRPAA